MSGYRDDVISEARDAGARAAKDAVREVVREEVAAALAGVDEHAAKIATLRVDKEREKGDRALREEVRDIVRFEIRYAARDLLLRAGISVLSALATLAMLVLAFGRRLGRW